MGLAPVRHAPAHIVLDLLGELLEDGAGGSPAARAGRDQRHEGAQPHGLQDLLRDDHLAGAVAAGLGGERDADGVADPLLQQHRQRRRGSDDSLRAHPRLGEAEMERVVALPGERAVDRDQVLHRRDLAGEHDLVRAEAERAGAFGAADRRRHQRVPGHRGGVLGRFAARVLVHHLGQQLLVEAAPVDPDADRAAVFQRDLDHGRELGVALGAEADIAGIDAVLGERLGAGRVLGQQLVADIVEVADQRHADALGIQRVADARHRGCGLFAVDGDADDLRPGAGERRRLRRRPLHVGGVGVGHRLDDDRAIAADRHVAHIYGDRLAARRRQLCSGHRLASRNSSGTHKVVAARLRVKRGFHSWHPGLVPGSRPAPDGVPGKARRERCLRLWTPGRARGDNSVWTSAPLRLTTDTDCRIAQR